MEATREDVVTLWREMVESLGLGSSHGGYRAGELKLIGFNSRPEMGVKYGGDSVLEMRRPDALRRVL